MYAPIVMISTDALEYKFFNLEVSLFQSIVCNESKYNWASLLNDTLGIVMIVDMCRRYQNASLNDDY